ncbi:MAG: winged helix-turn-helix domain-containing protein [Candidatus Nitrosopolaris sp.]
MRYRSRSEIVRSILEAAQEVEGSSRTRLMYKSYLAYSQLKEYLETLQENDLIDYEVGRRCYTITQKGIRLLQLQNKMEEIAPINYVNVKNS